MQGIWEFATVFVVVFLGVAAVVASLRYGWRVVGAVGWVLITLVGMMALSAIAMRVTPHWPLWVGTLAGPAFALVLGLVLIISPRYRQSPHTITIAIVLLALGLLGVLYGMAFLVAMVGFL